VEVFRVNFDGTEFGSCLKESIFFIYLAVIESLNLSQDGVVIIIEIGVERMSTPTFYLEIGVERVREFTSEITAGVDLTEDIA
jgi:hypothetical protein